MYTLYTSMRPCNFQPINAQAMLRQRDAEVEERGRLLLRTKVPKSCQWYFTDVFGMDFNPLPHSILGRSSEYKCCLQAAIEQLQQELAASNREQEVIKAEARQVVFTSP